MGLISGRLRGGALKPGFRMAPFGYKEHIETIELESDQDSVTFGDIPDAYEKLEIYFEAQNTGTDTAATTLPRFNGDTGDTNYESYEVRWDSSVSSQKKSDGRVTWVQSTDRPTNGFGILIEGYSNEDMKTTYRDRVVAARNELAIQHNGWWDSTDVVTEVMIDSSVGWASGSHFVLHGVNRV